MKEPNDWHRDRQEVPHTLLEGALIPCWCCGDAQPAAALVWTHTNDTPPDYELTPVLVCRDTEACERRIEEKERRTA